MEIPFQNRWLTLAIVVGLSASKFLAALLTKLVYRYNWREMLAMFSLSLPQVAATLAATIVGYRVGLLKEDVLNSVIVLMLFLTAALIGGSLYGYTERIFRDFPGLVVRR